eukprot:gene33516-44878_t
MTRIEIVKVGYGLVVVTIFIMVINHCSYDRFRRVDMFIATCIDPSAYLEPKHQV